MKKGSACIQTEWTGEELDSGMLLNYFFIHFGYLLMKIEISTTQVSCDLWTVMDTELQTIYFQFRLSVPEMQVAFNFAFPLTSLIVLVRPWLLFLSYLRLPTADFTDEYAKHTMLLFIMIIPLCSVLTNDMLCYDILSFFFFKCLPLLCQVLSLSVSDWNFRIVEK